MNKKLLLITLASVAALLTAGCRRLDPADGTGDLDLVFATEELGTKSWELTEPASLQNGGQFNHLLVVLVKDNGTDKTIYWDQKSFAEEGEGVTTGVMRFRNVKNGTYRAYAFANLKIDFNDDESYWKGQSWEYVAKELANDNNILSTNTAGDLVVIKGTESAVIASSAESLLTSDEAKKGKMLLTGTATVSIDGSTVKVNNSTTGKITLQRSFVRLIVEVNNPTGHPVKFDELSFGAFKPTKSYLLGKKTEGDLVPGDIPADPGYAEFGPASLPADPWTGTMTLYDTYLFENAAEQEVIDEGGIIKLQSRYRMYGHVIMDPGTAGAKSLYLGSGTKPTDPTDPDYDTYKGNGSDMARLAHGTNVAEPITNMLRGQAYKVLVNIYFGSSTGDFNFNVKVWTDGVGGSHTFK